MVDSQLRLHIALYECATDRHELSILYGIVAGSTLKVFSVILVRD